MASGYVAPRTQGSTGKVGGPRAQGKFVRPRTDPVQHGFSKCHAIPHHPFHIIYSTSSIPASGRMDGVVYSLRTAVWQPWSRDQKQQLARHPPKGTHHPCVPQRLTSEACPSAAERDSCCQQALGALCGAVRTRKISLHSMLTRFQYSARREVSFSCT